jgi:hypothetical protein
MEPVYRQSICIARFQDKRNPVHKLVVKVYYEIGGMNYIIGEQKQRGYYLSVIPQDITEHLTVTRSFTGYWVILSPTTRYSEKELILQAEYALKMNKFQIVLESVASKNGFKLEDYEHEI